MEPVSGGVSSFAEDNGSKDLKEPVKKRKQLQWGSGEGGGRIVSWCAWMKRMRCKIVGMGMFAILDWARLSGRVYFQGHCCFGQLVAMWPDQALIGVGKAEI